MISSLQKPLAAFGWAPFTHPHIDIRPPIKKFNTTTKSIEFLDGTSVHDVDVVLFATGYDFSFPFLPEINIENRRVKGLYQHVFHTRDPTLSFVGMVGVTLAPVLFIQLIKDFSGFRRPDLSCL